MISIKGIIRPFRDRFETKDASTRARLCEAFELLDRNIQEIGSTGSSAKHYTKIYSAVPVAIPNGVPTPIQFDSESSQNGGMHSTTTQNTRITIQRAGLYTIIANAQWPGVGAGGALIQLQIQVNGIIMIASRIDWDPGVGFVQDQIITGGDYFNIGDYIEIVASQLTGGPVNIPVVANFSPYCFVMEN